MAAVSENPVDDSSLSSLMDDLQEGTLLSLLEDCDLFSYLKDYPLSPTDVAQGECRVEVNNDDFDLSELFGDHMELVEYGCNVNREHKDGQARNATVAAVTPISSKRCSECKNGHQRRAKAHRHSHSGSDSDISSIDSNDSDSAEGSFSFSPRPGKKQRVDVNCQDNSFLMTCVQHDHCYVTPMYQAMSSTRALPTVAPEREVLINTEEENSSDTGYETMSTTTSPGANNAPNQSSTTHFASTSTTVGQISYNSVRAQGNLVDPVALIDARIKHFMLRHQVSLTEEEKETLKAEGLPIPTTLPLTKVEEKALKSVRRKIRNKVAAQESRKRKKQQVHDLEEKVRQFTSDNLRLKKKVENLETENRSLMAQLQKFQALLAGGTSGGHTTKVGACLMVIVLCFALFLGGWAPPNYWTTQTSDYYTTTTVRSRSLLSMETTENNLPQAACDWFRYIFMPEKHLPIGSVETEDRAAQQKWPNAYIRSNLNILRNNDSKQIVVTA